MYGTAIRPVERVVYGGKLPRAPRRLGGPPSLRNKKVHQNVPFFEKKQFNNFSPEGPCKNVWGARLFPRVPLWLSMGLIVIDTNE